jgi:pimeloyl-ACP methyl ester carboxylesterase
METSRSKPQGEIEHQPTPVEVSQSPYSSGRERVQGHRLYWEIHGQANARTVVLLHHGLGSVYSWRRQIPFFVKQGWRVVAFDRWGYGRSDPRPSFEPDFLLKDKDEALQLLEALGIERANIIGHSDGGTIALIIAAQYPLLVERLVTVAAHIYFEPKVIDGLERIAQTVRVPPLSKVLAREHGDRAQTLAQSWLNCWLDADSPTLSLLGELSKITCPVLVIQGELDEHATPKHARDIAEGVQDGELWLIPEVGHMPMHEAPEVFNHRVLRFLDEGDET